MGDNEGQKLDEINDLFEFILKVQERISPEVVSSQEVEGGEGRKGVLMIRGGTKWVKAFSVNGGKLVPTEGVDDARTVVTFDGVDAMRNLLQELLTGSPGAFSRARARGDVKIYGEHAIRDLSIFNRLLTKVGQALNSYDVKLGGE